MGYRRVNAETLHEILQRLRAGDSNRRIAVCLGLDRKTVNQYVSGMSKVVVSPPTSTTPQSIGPLPRHTVHTNDAGDELASRESNSFQKRLKLAGVSSPHGNCPEADRPRFSYPPPYLCAARRVLSFLKHLEDQRGNVMDRLVAGAVKLIVTSGRSFRKEGPGAQPTQEVCA